MNTIFDIASKVSTPLALGGVIAVVLFFILRTILRKGNIPPHLVPLVQDMVRGLLVLSVLGTLLGFAGYILKDLTGNECGRKLTYTGIVYLDRKPKSYVNVRLLEWDSLKITGPAGRFEFEYNREQEKDSITLYFVMPDSTFPKFKDTSITRRIVDLTRDYFFKSITIPASVDPATTRNTIPVPVKHQTRKIKHPPIAVPKGQKTVSVQYDSVYLKAGKTLTYNLPATDNNNNEGCPLNDNAVATNNQTFAQLVTGNAFEGVRTIYPDCTNSKQYRATRVIFKLVARPGVHFKPAGVTCSGPSGICAFQEDTKFLQNGPDVVIWTAKFFSAPIRLDFTVETTEDAIDSKQMNFSTSTNLVTVAITASSKNPMVSYNGPPFPLGGSGARCTLVKKIADDASGKVYQYRLE